MENRKLEIYLTKLERSLGPIAISDKAEIITEIKSHVLDALENRPESTVSQILNSLGEPEQVASRYLLERGLEPQSPPRHPIVKWLVIGFLGTCSILTISMLVLIWKFTPIVSVDENSGRVELFGGMINVNEKKTMINLTEDNSLLNNFSGEIKLSEDTLERVRMNFTNVSLDIENGRKGVIEYKCEISGEGRVVESEAEVAFNLKDTNKAKCNFKIPKNLSTVIEYDNGKVKVNDIENDLIVNGVNGKVEFNPKEGIPYDYKISIDNGVKDFFKSSEESSAYNIKVSLVNGVIKNRR